MNLQEGLIYAYSTKNNDKEIINPFLLYCRLSDVCSDSFLNKQDLEVYRNIINKINIFDILISYGIDDGLIKLRYKYQEHKNNIELDDYKRCVRYTVNCINPSYFNIQKTNKKALNMLYGFEIKDGELIEFKSNRKEVVIPNNVKIIKSFAFDGQDRIERIFIPKSVDIIRSFAFNNLSNLKEVILEDVEVIEKLAFNLCKNATIICKDNYCRKKSWDVFFDVYDRKPFIPRRCKVKYKSIKEK